MSNATPRDSPVNAIVPEGANIRIDREIDVLGRAGARAGVWATLWRMRTVNIERRIQNMKAGWGCLAAHSMRADDSRRRASAWCPQLQAGSAERALVLCELPHAQWDGRAHVWVSFLTRECARALGTRPPQVARCREGCEAGAVIVRPAGTGSSLRAPAKRNACCLKVQI